LVIDGETVRQADPEDTPHESWGLTEWARWAVRQWGEWQTASKTACQKKFQLGRALYQVKLRLEEPFSGWLKRSGIPKSSAYEALGLYETAGDEKAIAGLTVEAAQAKFGLKKPPPKHRQPHGPPPVEVEEPEDDEDDQEGDEQEGDQELQRWVGSFELQAPAGVELPTTVAVTMPDGSLVRAAVHWTAGGAPAPTPERLRFARLLEVRP
jgi:hypothetical protein